MTEQQIDDWLTLRLFKLHTQVVHRTRRSVLRTTLLRGGWHWTLSGVRIPPAAVAEPLEPAASPRPERTAPARVADQRGPTPAAKPTRCAADILLTLGAVAGQRLTTRPLLAALATRDHTYADAVVKATLARLRAHGYLVNDDDGRGYGLTEE